MLVYFKKGYTRKIPHPVVVHLSDTPANSHPSRIIQYYFYLFSDENFICPPNFKRSLASMNNI